jgi:two-component system, NtrC family, response regulator HydG
MAGVPLPDRTDVLVVDDDPDIRYSLRFLLEDAGYTVFEAPDGKPALERLRTHPRGMVVILDWTMPGMDGQALLHVVSADLPLATRNAYILVTAYVDAKRTLPLAFATLLTDVEAQVLSKPFDVDILLAAVERAAARLRQH